MLFMAKSIKPEDAEGQRNSDRSKWYEGLARHAGEAIRAWYPTRHSNFPVESTICPSAGKSPGRKGKAKTWTCLVGKAQVNKGRKAEPVKGLPVGYSGLGGVIISLPPQHWEDPFAALPIILHQMGHQYLQSDSHGRGFDGLMDDLGVTGGVEDPTVTQKMHDLVASYILANGDPPKGKGGIAPSPTRKQYNLVFQCDIAAGLQPQPANVAPCRKNPYYCFSDERTDWPDAAGHRCWRCGGALNLVLNKPGIGAIQEKGTDEEKAALTAEQIELSES